MFGTSTQENQLLKEDKLTRKSLISYGIGGVGLDFPFVIISFLLMYFYTNVVGVNMAAVGTIMLVTKVFDGISDIIFGGMLSHTQTKWGKCRPWLLRMMIPMPLSVLLLFTVPAASETVKLIYVFLTYNLANTVMLTVYAITYNSMNAVLTRDQNGRATLSITRQIFCFVGQIVLNGISLPLMAHFGNTQAAWIGMIAVYCILNVICIFINFWGCREIDPLAFTEDGGHAHDHKVPFIKELSAVITNKYWWMVFLIWTFLTFYQTMNSTAATYYSQFVLNNVGIVGMLNTIENTVMMVGVLASPLLLKKLSRRQLGLSGIVLAIAAQALVLLFPTNITMLMIAGGIRGLGVAPLQALTFALLSDVVEHVQWRSHIRTEGLVFAASSFGMKIASGIGSAVISFLYNAAGYDGLASVQTASALAMIKNIYYFCAPICCLIIFVCFLFYKLDREYPTVIEELKQREARGEL